MIHTLVHELAHSFQFNKFNESQFEEFAKLAWEKKADGGGKTNWVAREGGLFPSQYARQAPQEHFAEAIAFYILWPKHLKETNPKQYEWVNTNVFEGEEFPAEDDAASLAKTQHLVQPDKDLGPSKDSPISG